MPRGRKKDVVFIWGYIARYIAIPCCCTPSVRLLAVVIIGAGEFGIRVMSRMIGGSGSRG